MTYDINSKYAITFSIVGSGNHWTATGEIHERGSMAKTGIHVRVTGRTNASVYDRALREADAKCPPA